MEWLILRLHRQAVARFGPLTADLSNWIRLYSELLKPNKELRGMMKKLKAESKAMDAEIRRITAETKEYRIRLQTELDRLKDET